MQKFTDHIRETCKKIGLSINGLFETVGMDNSTFYTWEKKPEKVSAASLRKMDKGLDAMTIEINRLRLRINSELMKLSAGNSEAA